MIYVLNIEGQPLMPCKEAKARKLLKQNKAKIYKREPFTIQLLFVCENQTQDITLGVDAGSKHIGLSATTKEKELYAADVELRNDIVELLAIRRQNRRARRVAGWPQVLSKRYGRISELLKIYINYCQ